VPRKHHNLFGRIASFQALREAARRAFLGKRRKPGAAAFQAGLERELLRLERQLLSAIYKPGRYLEIQVHDPKPRMVSAAPFRDRVVHHAVHEVIAPLFESGFIEHSFANRTGKGTHAAVRTFEKYRDRFRYVLRCDIFRYFPAIDHAVLKMDLRRRIACERTLWLLDLIVDGSNAQEPVELYFPGDDLFAPVARCRGLPIGNLTSQFFANVYLNPLDHFVTERLGAPYLRYVDDFALFANDAAKLDEWRARISTFLEGRRLRLHPRKTFIAETSEAAEFLGLVLLDGGQRRLPEANVQRFRNRLRGIGDRLVAGSMTPDDARVRIRAWVAHAAHTDSFRLRQAIFTQAQAPTGAESDWGLTDPVSARPSRRFLEQQSMESPLGEPQQGHRNKPEQQHGVPRGEHASMPELRWSRPSGESRGCVQGLS